MPIPGFIEDPAGSGLYTLAPTNPIITGSWHTLVTAREQWIEAPYEDDVLTSLLETSKEQCIEYAPALANPLAVPLRYLQAQLMQARALWQSTQANSSDQMGSDGFTVTVYPMDRTIKNVLRPKRGVPIVG